MSDMPIVQLSPHVECSRLGYGCASLMARTGRRESLRLLDVAFDAGITHFDVARAYGYGEAESVVGKFIARRRDAVTVTTKVGIQPPRRTPALRLAKAAARRLAALSPRSRSLMRRRASAMVSHARFDAAEARASFEQSLRELDTDHVDILLLHDPRPGDVTDELVEFAEECLLSGRARAVGVAGGRADGANIAAASEVLAGVVQMPDSALEPLTPTTVAPAARAVVTHSVLAGPLAAAPETAVSAPPAELALAAALRRNPAGPVLVSSRDAAHIRRNAAVASEPPPAEMVDAFEEQLSGGHAERSVEARARGLGRTTA